MFFKVKHPESFVVCLEVFWIGLRLGLGKNTWVADFGRGLNFGIEANFFGKQTRLDFGFTNTFRLGTVVDTCGCSYVYIGPITLGYSVDHPEADFAAIVKRVNADAKAIISSPPMFMNPKIVQEIHDHLKAPIVEDFEEMPSVSSRSPNDTPANLVSGPKLTKPLITFEETPKKRYKEKAREAQIESQKTK